MMHSEPNRAESLFVEALKLNPDERTTFVVHECGDDAALRKRVLALLVAHDEATGFLPDDSPGGFSATRIVETPLPSRDQVSLTEQPGTIIGHYKLLEKIGEGGCGVVYMAEQSEPVKRRVALKVIKLGMDTKQVVARFEAERQALALMDHPHMAKVLDAGSTESGRPYFVMELVRGIKVTAFCDQQKLATAQRLKLFIQICSAIQHAHQKGIIHRDLKPSNVLVTLHDGVPVPKVIDFGIAKATNDQKLTNKTLFTAFEQFIGTPAYMSPEQAEMSGLDIDTRSDIYSLGVLLYELLTGRTPFDAQELLRSGIDGIRKTLREQEPVKPSTKLNTLTNADLTTVANARHADAPKLLHSIRGDLDWIVMKCLEKDRTRRYETANGLAADLKRHLDNEPVVARPPSTSYQLQKLVRRNKLAFAAAGAVAVSLLIGIVASTRQAAVANRERMAAEKARAAESEQRMAAVQALAKAEAEGARADQKATEARASLYAADMKLAQLALAENDLGRAVAHLQKHKPGPEEPDYRGFEWRYLWNQSRGQEIASLATTNPGIVALDFSPDGKWLAAGGSGGASIIEVATWKPMAALTETNRVLAIQFSPDGKSLVTSGPAGVRLWDTLNWQPKQALEDSAGLAAYSPDGRILITLGSDGLRVRDAHTLLLIHSLPDLALHLQWGIYGNLAFSADGHFMAALVEESEAATNRVSIRIWDVGQLHKAGRFPPPSTVIDFPEVASVCALALTEDGRRLATSTVLGQLSVWDTVSGTRMAFRRDLAQRSLRLKYRTSDGFLIGTGWDQTIRIWRQDGTNLVETSARKGHLGRIGALADTPHGSYLATAGGGVIKLWNNIVSESGDTHDGPGDEVVPDHFNLLNFLPGDRTLVSTTVDEKLEFWDIETKQPRRTFTNVSWHVAARVSPDQRWVAIARTNGLVELLDVARETVAVTLTGHTNEVRRIFFTPDSRRILTASVRQSSAQGDTFPDDSWVRLWDVPSGRLLAETNLHEAIYSMTLAPDGETFAIHPQGERVEVRQTRDFALLYHVPIEPSTISRMAFSPDGRLLAVSCGNEFNLWELPARRLRFVGRSLLNINWLTIAPDGQTLASAAHDRAVKLWNVKTGQEMLSLPFAGGCFQAEFSGDGRTLAVGTYLIEGTNLNYNVHLLHAPSLAEIAKEEAAKSSSTRHLR